MADTTTPVSADRAPTAGAHTDPPDVSDVLRRTAIGTAGLIALVALLGLLGELFVFDGAIGDAEADLVASIAGGRIGFLDSAARIGSSLSDTWTVIGVMVGAISMLVAACHRREAGAVFLAVAVEFATFLAVGRIIGRDRPDVEPLGSVPSTPSFPSGHVAAAFVLYGVLVLVARTLATRSAALQSPLMWLLPATAAVVVAASRAYEGVHYPTDVLAGALVGVGALLVAGWATGLVGDGDHRSSG